MIEWGIPYTLTTPQGTLEFNQATTSPYASGGSYYYRLQPETCKATIGPIRREVDDVPSADGSLPHAAFMHGMTVNLGVDLIIFAEDGSDFTPACDADLCVMWDTLILHLRSLVNPTIAQLYGGECRWGYTPSCGNARMLDHVRVAEWVDPSYDVPMTSTTFALDSDLPYEIDQAESMPDEVDLLDTFTNIGNTETFPAFRVFAGSAAISTFLISNNTTGQQILYDSTLPGANTIAAGHYVEILCFRNTIYLDGSSANYKPGLDVESSDFFSLIPGDNELEFICATPGATCEILWNNAWAG